ncbi:MAG: flippase-like domain-containing protein [Magnetococcus sp. THC-1_WYH]
MNKPYVRWMVHLLKFVVAGAVLYWLFKGGKLHWGLILEGAMSPSVIVVGLACNLILVSMAAVRWNFLLKGQGVSLPFLFVHHLTYVTAFFNQIIPGGIGGDALRLAFVLKQPNARKGQAALTVVLDRFLGLFSLLLIAALFSVLSLAPILASPPLTLLATSTILLVLVGPPILLLFFWLVGRSQDLPRWLQGKPGGLRDRVFRLTKEFSYYFRSGKKQVFWALVVSMVSQMILIVSLIWIAYKLSILVIPMEAFFVAGPWAWVANILPISPGGLGVGEAAFDQVCQWLSPASAAVAFGTVFLINRMFMILGSLPGLLFFLFRSRWLHEDQSL